MARIILIVLLFIFSYINTTLSAQTVEGDWKGTLEVQGTKLTINFHISKTDNGYTSTMDSPDQGAMGIPTSSTSFTENQLVITVDNIQVTYTGTLKGDLITGTFKQGSFETPLNFNRSTSEETKKKTRPQDPEEPYPYHVEDIHFTNTKANNIKLAGTLTLPKNIKNPPAAILISGSGPQNRNEELLNHRPFLVLADYLTRNGIAVLRYDDRGVAESEGVHKGATSADFATDVEAAVAYLKSRNDIDRKKIGLVGHSEGGFIAPMVASKNKTLAFVVLLAGTGIDGEKVLLTQSKRAQELAGEPAEVIDFREELLKKTFNVVKVENDQSKIETKIQESLRNFRNQNSNNSLTETLTDKLIQSQARTFSDPWMVYFIKTNPEQFLSKVKCPVLAINGEKDFQVIPELNLPGIESALKLAKNKDVTIKELKDLNHLFQTSETGSPDEYSVIEETFSPEALAIVKDWILAKTK
ncbi:alpha/beta fold hydrolase [Flavobacteriaceae bacterium R38]|nr:alpha/beta fold hydrolase [Flavobacteriaceae bacterium R38]